MTVPFGHQNEHFRSSLFLVLGNRLMTCLVAIACLLVRIAASNHCNNLSYIVMHTHKLLQWLRWHFYLLRVPF